MNIGIPALQVSDTSTASGNGTINLPGRKVAQTGGTFTLTIRQIIQFLPGSDYPSGSFFLDVDLSDGLRGQFASTSIDLINSHGKDQPTVFLTGRCQVKKTEDRELPKGLRYWLMIAGSAADRKGNKTPNVVGFAIHDHTGARIAYGTGLTEPSAFTVQAE